MRLPAAPDDPSRSVSQVDREDAAQSPRRHVDHEQVTVDRRASELRRGLRRGDHSWLVERCQRSNDQRIAAAGRTLARDEPAVGYAERVDAGDGEVGNGGQVGLRRDVHLGSDAPGDELAAERRPPGQGGRRRAPADEDAPGRRRPREQIAARGRIRASSEVVRSARVGCEQRSCREHERGRVGDARAAQERRTLCHRLHCRDTGRPTQGRRDCGDRQRAAEAERETHRDAGARIAGTDDIPLGRRSSGARVLASDGIGNRGIARARGDSDCERRGERSVRPI